MEQVKINNAKKKVSELSRDVEILKAKLSKLSQHKLRLEHHDASFAAHSRNPAAISKNKEIELYIKKLEFTHPAVVGDYKELVALRERQTRYKEVINSTGQHMENMLEIQHELLSRRNKGTL